MEWNEREHVAERADRGASPRTTAASASARSIEYERRLQAGRRHPRSSTTGCPTTPRSTVLDRRSAGLQRAACRTPTDDPVPAAQARARLARRLRRRDDELYTGIGMNRPLPFRRATRSSRATRRRLLIAEPLTALRIDAGVDFGCRRFGNGVPYGGDRPIDEVYCGAASADVRSAVDERRVPGFAAGTQFVRERRELHIDSRTTELCVGLHGRCAAPSTRTASAATSRATCGCTATSAPPFEVWRHRALYLGVSADDELAFGKTPIPFSELVQLGGPDDLRGFRRGRFRDASSMLATVEYRWPVWMWMDGSLFFDYGGVFGPKFTGFAVGELRPDVGIGFRMHSADKFVIRIQVAYGVGGDGGFAWSSPATATRRDSKRRHGIGLPRLLQNRRRGERRRHPRLGAPLRLQRRPASPSCRSYARPRSSRRRSARAAVVAPTYAAVSLPSEAAATKRDGGLHFIEYELGGVGDVAGAGFGVYQSRQSGSRAATRRWDRRRRQIDRRRLPVSRSLPLKTARGSPRARRAADRRPRSARSGCSSRSRCCGATPRRPTSATRGSRTSSTLAINLIGGAITWIARRLGARRAVGGDRRRRRRIADLDAAVAGQARPARVPRSEFGGMAFRRRQPNRRRPSPVTASPSERLSTPRLQIHDTPTKPPIFRRHDGCSISCPWTSALDSNSASAPSAKCAPAKVRASLGMLLSLFMLMIAYYILKTVREPLDSAASGAEMKSYAAGLQALALDRLRAGVRVAHASRGPARSHPRPGRFLLRQSAAVLSRR